MAVNNDTPHRGESRKSTTSSVGVASTKKRVTLPLNFGSRSSKAAGDSATGTGTAKEVGHKRKRHATSGATVGKKKPAVKRMKTTTTKTTAKTSQGSTTAGKVAEPKKHLKKDKEGKGKQEDNTKTVADMRPIISYAIATADTARNRCVECNKGIPIGALCFSKLERAGRHVKKRDATSTNWHQNCFTMPAALVKFPVECLRGWAQLAEKQQRRVRALFAAGEGATMRKVTEEMEREKAANAATKEVKSTTSSDVVTKNNKQLTSKITSATTSNAANAAANGDDDDAERQHVRFD
ncbi:hypothetical protein BDF22DRAFT_319072 [Syncephalis plumigaleata]|nr:hypothetical protein BDF22DRAFT_319072 [Syncephalis plumigaleata]